MKYYAVISVFISGLLYHIVHELSHVIVGKICGLKLVKIEWFSRRHRGTKITFENEEIIIDESNHDIPKAWLFTNMAGITATIFIGYILTIIFLLLPPDHIRLSVWAAAAIFLLCDAGYAVLGAFNNSGDLYIINKYLGKKSYLTKIISVIILIFNVMLFVMITRK
jgi:hypothetical protein